MSQWFRFHNKRLKNLAHIKKTAYWVVFEVSQEELEEIDKNPEETWKELNKLGIWESYNVVEFAPINSYGKRQGNSAEMRNFPEFRDFKKSNSLFRLRF